MYIGSILHENDEFRKNKGKCHEENANAVIRRINLGFNFPRSSIPKSHPLKNPSSVANANMSVYRKDKQFSSHLARILDSADVSRYQGYDDDHRTNA